MAFHLELARDRYQGRLTWECFMAEVPDWIQYADDDVLFPSVTSLPLMGLNALSSHRTGSFWMPSAPSGTSLDKNSTGPGLRIIVMPYTPVADAHQLHEAVLHPELLPISFAEAFLDPELADDGEAQVQGDAEEEDEDGPELVIWDERVAVVTLPDLHVNINFIIANYGLLWAKAERFCVSTFTTDALEDLLDWLAFCDEHLPQPTQALLVVLQENLLQARRQLIFALYQHGSNPHNVVCTFFPAMHDQVYQDCVHCDPNIEEEAKLDSPDTMQRLDDALVDVGMDQYHASLTIDQARLQLMSAEGLLEGRRHEHSVIPMFHLAKSNFRQALLPLVNEVRVVRRRPTVMGVPFFQADE